LKQEWQKRPAGIRQTDCKNLVWFGEIERKLAKLSKTTFTYRSSVAPPTAPEKHGLRPVSFSCAFWTPPPPPLHLEQHHQVLLVRGNFYTFARMFLDAPCSSRICTHARERGCSIAVEVTCHFPGPFQSEVLNFSSWRAPQEAP
jgi:hypothetical protein